MDVVYLDNCATTQVAPEVVEAMLPFLTGDFGNPSSPHLLGKRARRAVDKSTEQVASLIGAPPEHVVFTSGATESNNIVLQGVFGNDPSGSAVVCPIDHKSVIEVGRALGQRGIDVRTMRIDGAGLVDLGHLRSLFDAHTRIVSIGWVNSELGTIQPVAAMAEMCARHGVLLHVDGAQAAARVAIDVATGIDALSLSAHKMNGPKGIGALYISPTAQDRLMPLLYGGGQHPLRSGTIPTHLVVGMGQAAELTFKRREEGWIRAIDLREETLRVFAERVPDFQVNGALESAVPHLLNLRVPGITGDSLVAGLAAVALSTGAACTSSSLEPSYVLRGIGLTPDEASASLRMCFDPWMDIEELRHGLRMLCDRIERLRTAA